MPFLDFFRNLFGVKAHQDYTNSRPEISKQEHESFRNPIWVNEEEDDEDETIDFRQPHRGMHFQIFGDPFEMTRYFESEMDNILKNFFNGFGFGPKGSMLPFDDESTFEALPDPEAKTRKSLRDQILDREFDSNNFTRNCPKVDSDLDGKLNADELKKVWKDPIDKEVQSVEPWVSKKEYFSGKLSSTQIIQRGNGILEKRQKFKDSDGNEQVIVTRRMGDQTYETITKKDKNGVETKTENLINLDESEVKSFIERWNQSRIEGSENYPSDLFSWPKFFGFEPKL